MSFDELFSGFALGKALPVLLLVAIFAALDLTGKYKHKNHHYLFGCLLGTVLSVAFLKLIPLLFTGQIASSPYAVALGVVLVIVGWKLLFGPWDSHVKATVLATFVFWIALHLIFLRTGIDRVAVILAMGFALLPVVFWCALFLPYHRENWSKVALMFFAGMSATAPILFYDALVRGGRELQFFYFRIIPESFNSSSDSFITGQLQAAPSVQTTLITIALSFALVALVEEGAKYWVLTRSGKHLFSSIDDVLELSIVVAIGFAFAENILNSSYFPTFVRTFLLTPGSNDWLAFLGNVAGRSVLTSMVHIASTGLMGYFVGRAIFAPFLLRSAVQRKAHYPVTDIITNTFSLSRLQVFRTVSIFCGFVFAVTSHALANFLVTLPDVLPGHPRTLGDLFGSPQGSPFNSISLVVLPSLIYVVGGFLLLTALLEWRENREERGRLQEEETFVTAAD